MFYAAALLQAGARCIHIAAERGHIEVVRALLMKGENVDTKTNVWDILKL